MTTAEDLYGLLPAVHRLRDAEVGGGGPGPLRALAEVLAAQADVVDADLDLLADAWFIETCADWLVPYLGDLVGATPLHPVGAAAGEPRAYVANTMSYRRAKGTLAVLEQLTRDVTGWPTRAAEMFPRLAWTQHVNHVRDARTGTPDLRDAEVAALVDGPFDTTPRTVGVRSIGDAAGRHNLPNIGLFAYRLQPQTIVDAEAAPEGTPGRFRLDPLGRDVPLFAPGQPETALTDLAAEADLPGRLRRRPLRDELEALRAPSGAAARPVWFPPARPVVTLSIPGDPGGAWQPIPAEELVICDLGDWRPPPPSHTVVDPDGGNVTRPITAALDPVRGRVTFRPAAAPAGLRSGHTTAQPMPLGGGPYDRRDLDGPSLDGQPAGRPPDRRLLVGRSLPIRDGLFRTLTDAVTAWQDAPGGVTEIVLTDNVIHDDALQGAATLVLGGAATLLIVAADAPVPLAGRLPDPTVPLRRTGARAVLTGDIDVRGDGPDPDGEGALVLDGVWVSSTLTALVGNLGGLRLVDTTVVPGAGAIDIRSGEDGRNDALDIVCVRTVTGPLALDGTTRSVRLDTAVVDADGSAIDAPGSDLTIVDTTVLGGVSARTLRAANTIFGGPVTVVRSQEGCLRYCVLPVTPTTRTPRRYRCQPDLALAAAAGDEGPVDDAAAAAVRARLRPAFTSLHHGDPAYCQLSARTAPEIATGAEDGSEMGVHRALRQPARLSNLSTALSEYLRAGLQAGALFVT